MSRASRLETSTTKTEVNTDGKAFVTLRFAGDDLDPDEISAAVKPTRAHRKGETFFAGPRAGNLRGRTGMWFLATDKLVPSDDLQDHLAFVQKLLSPTPGDTSRIAKLRAILRAHALPRPSHLLLARRAGRARPANSRTGSSPAIAPWPPTSKPISRSSEIVEIEGGFEFIKPGNPPSAQVVAICLMGFAPAISPSYAPHPFHLKRYLARSLTFATTTGLPLALMMPSGPRMP